MDGGAKAGNVGFAEPRRLAFHAGVAGGLVLFAACSRPTPSVSEGRTLYQANGCASCHGISGRGDGPTSVRLGSKPADLRDRALFIRGGGEMEIARTLAEGIHSTEASIPQLHRTHHELAMPKFDHLTELERRSIALYVISLQDVPN
jgi:mono/diheme cytochrome c family protein